MKVKLISCNGKNCTSERSPTRLLQKVSWPDGRRENLVFGTNEEQTNRDVRAIEDQFSLDRHGFTYKSMNSGFSEFESKKRTLQEYLPWAASIMKQEAGDAERVFVFDWRVRV